MICYSCEMTLLCDIIRVCVTIFLLEGPLLGLCVVTSLRFAWLLGKFPNFYRGYNCSRTVVEGDPVLLGAKQSRTWVSNPFLGHKVSLANKQATNQRANAHKPVYFGEWNVRSFFHTYKQQFIMK